MKKVVREVKSILDQEGVRFIGWKKGRTHLKMEIDVMGTTRTLVLSASPKNLDIMFKSVRKQLQVMKREAMERPK